MIPKPQSIYVRQKHFERYNICESCDLQSCKDTTRFNTYRMTMKDIKVTNTKCFLSLGFS